jgi:hypothetical protein
MFDGHPPLGDGAAIKFHTFCQLVFSTPPLRNCIASVFKGLGRGIIWGIPPPGQGHAGKIRPNAVRQSLRLVMRFLGASCCF